MREKFVVYGRNPVREALRGPRRVYRVWQAEEAETLQREAAMDGVPVVPVSRDELGAIANSRDHQGVAAEVEPYGYANAETLLDDEDALVIVLDEIQDPQNLGAVCRSAECAGATGIVIPERRSAAVTPAVCKASAGAVEHLSVARVRNVADFLALARERGAWVYGAEAGATAHYTELDYDGRTVVVLGAEGRGIRPRVRAGCDGMISLPVRGAIESLNVSSAATVILYEALRKRSARSSEI
jgi:23S rRNA (guanosine2251-2'-O)-methyltransferase